jgi:hypothetical protein
MPKLSNQSEKRVQRILIVGDPGTGKTCCVGHLLEHGQKLFVADFDNQIDVLRHIIPAKFHENLVYANLVDKVYPDPVSGYPRTDGKPTAFRKFVRLVRRWVDDDGTDYGVPETWDENTWLVIDNLTAMGQATLMFSLDFKGRMGQRISLSVLGDAINRVEGVTVMLRGLPINTITLAHLGPVNVEKIKDEEDAEDDVPTTVPEQEKMSVSPVSKKHYPVTLGRKLPKRIGGNFTAILQTDIVGSGTRTQRIIRTVPSDIVDIKFPALPGSLPAELPITDLFRIIEALRKEPA